MIFISLILSDSWTLKKVVTEHSAYWVVSWRREVLKKGQGKGYCCCCCCWWCCCWCWCRWCCCVGWNQEVNDWGPFLVGENYGGVGWTRLRILLNQEEARLSLYLQPLNLKDQSQNWKKKEREWECWCWCWCALLCYALRSSLQIAAKIGQEDFV